MIKYGGDLITEVKTQIEIIGDRCEEAAISSSGLKRICVTHYQEQFFLEGIIFLRFVDNKCPYGF